MEKNINNIEEIETVNEEEVMETETKQKFGAKVIGGVKKHGKKILGIVGAGVAVAVAYGLGKKAGGECDNCFEDDTDLEFIEDDSTEIDPE